MLKALILENFKAFGGRRVIPIRPITLIFGPNSAGKSAILQSLLMLKQTITDPDTGDVPIRLKGSLVDLGSFRDIVYRHDMDRVCEITPFFWDDIAFSNAAPTVFCTLSWLSGDEVDFGLGVRLAQSNDAGRLEIESFPLYLDDTDTPFASLRSELEVKGFPPVSILPGTEVGPPKFFAEYMEKVRQSERRFVGRANRQHSLWGNYFKDRVEPNLAEAHMQLVNYGEDAKRIRRSGSPLEKLALREEMPDEVFERLSDYWPNDFIADVETLASLTPLSRRRFLIEKLQEPSSRRYDKFGREIIPDPPVHWAQKMLVHRLVTGSENSTIRPLDLHEMAVEMSTVLRDKLERIIYIGPLRNYPERHYLFSGAEPSSVGTAGQMAADMLMSRPDLIHRINEELAGLEIEYGLETQRLRDQHGEVSDVYALVLVDTKSGVRVSLRDVGFGISQVLPILVQSILAKDNTVIIEQPELHLHPRLQAELADVFIRSANLEHGFADGTGNTFIIETHSEHLLLRIVRRIRETSHGTLPEGLPDLRPEDVSIIYVQPTENGSVPLVMDLDEDGELLTAWPNGFFEEGFRERFA